MTHGEGERSEGDSELIRDDGDDEDSDDQMEFIEVLESELFGLEDDSEEPPDPDVQPVPLGVKATAEFNHHDAAVFACDIHPNGKLAASGGEDEKAFVFDMETGQITQTIIGFNDSVTMVEWSHDGKYLATGDMKGTVIVWKLQGDGYQTWNLDEIAWLRWHSQANVLLVGGSDVWLIKVPSGQMKCYPGFGVMSEVGDFLPDGKRAVCGYLDGSLRIIELSQGTSSSKFSSGWNGADPVLSLAVHPKNNLVAVGFHNSHLAIVNTTNEKVVAKLECTDGPKEDEETSVETIAFGGEEGLNLVVAGTDLHVHIWDYSRMILRHKIRIEESVTRMIWPAASPYIYVGTRAGPVNIYNPLSGQAMVPFDGNNTSFVLDLKISKDRKHLLTGSDDNVVRVFELGSETPCP